MGRGREKQRNNGKRQPRFAQISGVLALPAQRRLVYPRGSAAAGFSGAGPAFAGLAAGSQQKNQQEAVKASKKPADALLSRIG